MARISGSFSTTTELIPTTTYNNDNNNDASPYVFFDPDTKQNIIHIDNQKPDIYSFKTTKCATLEKIIEKITLKEFSDDVFVKDFLCTYRDYTTPLKLISLLKSRYDGPQPWDSQETILRFLKERESIRQKVVMIVTDFVPTLRSEELTLQPLRDVLVPLSDLIKDNHDITITIPEKVTGRSRAKSQILSATQIATLRFAWNPNEGVGDGISLNSSIDLSTHKKVSTPTPAVTQKSRRLTLRRKKKSDLESLASEYADSDTGDDGGIEDADMNSIRIARELTLMEHELLCPVSTWEFLHQAWNKSKKEDMAPNILALTEWFNRSSCWFSTKIVAKDTPEHRAAVIETVIDIGLTFLQLHNYSGLMQVLACLNSSAIDRLQQTWALLSNKTWSDFQTLNNIMRTEKNFKNYRQVLKELSSSEPCIPYLGMMLTDYTFMDDNNPKYLDENDQLVNIQRIQLIGAKMREFSSFQNSSYKNTIPTNPDIREAILSERVWDDSEIFRLSKVREESSAIKIEPGQGRRGKFGTTSRSGKRASFLGNSATGGEAGLSNREWELLMTNASKVQYQHNQIVFEEGITNSNLFRIIEGGVRFEKEGADGPIVVARVGEGQVFGEMSFLGKNATSATAVADSQSNSPVVLSVIETSFIDELFESEHELAATFYKHLAIMVATRLKSTVASATKNPPPSPSLSPSSSLSRTSTAVPEQNLEALTPRSRAMHRSPSSPLVMPTPASPQPRPSRPTVSPSPSPPSLAPPVSRFTRSPSANSLSPLSRISLHHGQRRSSEQLTDTLASSTLNLSPDSPDVASTAAADTPAGKTRLIDLKFERRFKDLSDKVVIKVYVCKFGVTGELYITKNYLCFYGKMLGMEKKKIIPWALVTNLDKTKHLTVEKTKATKKTTKKFLFKTAADLDEAFGIISLIWKNQSKSQIEWEGEIETETDRYTLSSNLHSPSLRRPSAISKIMTLAVDIPGLPTKEDWNIIMKGSKPVSYGKGEVIIHEGDKLQKVFQISRGECVVQRKVDGTDSVLILSKMNTHDFFGEISFLLKEGASGSVVAGEGGTEVVALGGDFVNILLSAKPLLASRFYKYLAVLLQRRLRAFQDNNNK